MKFFGIIFSNPFQSHSPVENRLQIDCSDPEQINDTFDFLNLGTHQKKPQICSQLQNNHLTQTQKNVLFCMLGISITMSPREILTRLEDADQQGAIQILKDMSLDTTFEVYDAKVIAGKLAGAISDFMSHNLAHSLARLIEFMIDDCLQVNLDHRTNVIKNYQIEYPYKHDNTIIVFIFKIYFNSDHNHTRIGCCSCQRKPLRLDNCSVIFQVDDLDQIVTFHQQRHCRCLTQPQEYIINGLKKVTSNPGVNPS